MESKDFEVCEIERLRLRGVEFHPWAVDKPSASTAKEAIKYYASSLILVDIFLSFSLLWLNGTVAITRH